MPNDWLQTAWRAILEMTVFHGNRMKASLFKSITRLLNIHHSCLPVSCAGEGGLEDRGGRSGADKACPSANIDAVVFLLIFCS